MLQQPVKVEANAVIVLEIEAADKENNTQHFQQTEKFLANTPFCLLVLLHQPLTSEQATDLTAFLFFSNYYKPGGTPQILIGGGNMDVIRSGIEQFQQTANAQGFPAIQIIPTSALPEVYSSTNQPAVRETYKSRLQSTVGTTDPLYIKAQQFADIQSLAEALAEEEALFGKQNPVLYALKMQNRELQNQVQQLQLFSRAAQQEISNQVSHNQILRSSSQATALQNYYNNEYEVLPLWFKRLGHVVKALMGKRSFKSLYSDKVKKYRH